MKVNTLVKHKGNFIFINLRGEIIFAITAIIKHPDIRKKN